MLKWIVLSGVLLPIGKALRRNPEVVMKSTSNARKWDVWKTYGFRYKPQITLTAPGQSKPVFLDFESGGWSVPQYERAFSDAKRMTRFEAHAIIGKDYNDYLYDEEDLKKVVKTALANNHPDRGGNPLVVEAVQTAINFIIQSRGHPDRRDYQTDKSYDEAVFKWKEGSLSSVWETDATHEVERWTSQNLDDYELTYRKKHSIKLRYLFLEKYNNMVLWPTTPFSVNLTTIASIFRQIRQDKSPEGKKYFEDLKAEFSKQKEKKEQERRAARRTLQETMENNPRGARQRRQQEQAQQRAQQQQQQQQQKQQQQQEQQD